MDKTRQHWGTRSPTLISRLRALTPKGLTTHVEGTGAVSRHLLMLPHASLTPTGNARGVHFVQEETEAREVESGDSREETGQSPGHHARVSQSVDAEPAPQSLPMVDGAWPPLSALTGHLQDAPRAATTRRTCTHLYGRDLDGRGTCGGCRAGRHGGLRLGLHVGLGLHLGQGLLRNH